MKTVEVKIWGGLRLEIPDNAYLVSDRRGSISVRFEDGPECERDITVKMKFNVPELEEKGIRVVSEPEMDT